MKPSRGARCTECGRIMYPNDERKATCEPRCLACRQANPRKQLRACVDCGAESQGKRCRACHIASAAGVSVCTECGERMTSRSTTASPRCQPCRVAARAKRSKCPDCGDTKSPGSECCRTCRAKRQTVRASDDGRLMRKHREHAAPGIRPCDRERLLAKWKRQGRRCAYCPDLADTIDHVVPLVRGGTNYEGNLVPACRRCNGSKWAYTVMEWRHGRRARRMTKAPDWKPKAKPFKIEAIKGERVELFRVCVCGKAYAGKAAYCTARCAMRSRYRLKVGIPLDARPYMARMHNA